MTAAIAAEVKPRELPIIMTGANVLATMEGRKTQTRRVINFPAWFLDEYTRFGAHEIESELVDAEGPAVGDRRWVRETWNVLHACPMKCPRWGGEESCPEHRRVVYRTGGDDQLAGYVDQTGDRAARWRSPRFMPRWASRVLLEITAVRAQRLHEISDDDIRAEGAIERDAPDQFSPTTVVAVDGKAYMSPRAAWAALWDKLNLRRSPWARNGWIWALTYRVVSVAGVAS